MPTAGTSKVVVRIPPDLLEEMQLTIATRNVYTREEPWSVSDFIRVAICEKIAKMRRSRGVKRGGDLMKVVKGERLELE